jgi:hypothetical protein
VKTYLALRDDTKSAWLAHHATLWERLGFTSPWGHLQDEATFNRMHAAITQAIAQHGPFDTSLDYAQHAWNFRIVPDNAVPDDCQPGYRLQCDLHIDQQAVIEGILAAVIAIVITILCPPLAAFAGFLGTIIIGVAMLILANMAAEFVTHLCGASADEHAAQLNQWAAEAA